MKRFVTFLFASVLLPPVAQADSFDTLKFLLNKSDLVVLGKIASVPLGFSTEAGVVNYVCDFEVSDVLKGDDAVDGKTIKITIIRFEQNEKDRHPLVKREAQCIVFLKEQPRGSTPHWNTADVWFGIQYASPWMARTLKQLAKESSKQDRATKK